jgi:predicted secreted protein
MISASADAQTEDPILSLPEGQVILHISATERKEVEQDLLVATLAYSATNRDARALQDAINGAMAKALDRARQETRVKANTGAYQIYEIVEPRTKEKKWQGQQSLTLKSKEASTLLELAGDLQNMGLKMNNLQYILAPETAVAVQDSLMEAALAQLQARADRAAKALGKSNAELRDVRVEGNDTIAQPRMYRGMAMEMEAASMAAPVAAAGETTISLSVSARAILKP